MGYTKRKLEELNVYDIESHLQKKQIFHVITVFIRLKWMEDI